MATEPKARLPADRTSAGPLPAGVGAPAKTATFALVVGFMGLVACLLVFGYIAARHAVIEFLYARHASFRPAA